jgi:hypothetical protein
MARRIAVFVASLASLEPSVASKIFVEKMLIDILLLPQWLSQDPELRLLWCDLHLDVTRRRPRSGSTQTR